jgi:hypothetical protein
MQTGRESDTGVQETDGAEVDATPQQSDSEAEAPQASDETSEVDSEPVEESARETVARILAKAADGAGDEDSDAKETAKDPKQVRDADGKFKPAAKNAKEPLPEEFDPDLSPPERFTARAKELFHNLPKGLKRELNKTVKDLEGMGTKATQQARQLETETRDLAESVRPFERVWAERGLRRAEAISALAAAHEKLINPQTAVPTWLGIGRDMGIKEDVLQAIQEHLSGGQPQQGQAAGVPDISSHPEFVNSQKQIAQLSSWVEQQRSREIQAAAKPIVDEMAAVRDERNPVSGQYLRPELHDPEFLGRTKPLVSELVRITPGLGYGEALKRVYSSLTGNYPAASAQGMNQTRLPASDTQKRAAQAAVSVRGRSAPSNGGMSVPDSIPNSARDTVRLALDQLRRGA